MLHLILQTLYSTVIGTRPYTKRMDAQYKLNGPYPATYVSQEYPENVGSVYESPNVTKFLI